jgi:two-component system chemotaxis sensor kinase CheA
MKPMDLDLQFVADALPAFLSEAREQIASIEQLLLQLEDAPDDRELLDALFRCAHTVKGSAGIFGLDAVVAFTHHVESLLDRLRAGALQLTPALDTLLLQCNDQIRALVDAAGQPASDGTVDTDGDAARAALVVRLQAAGAGGDAPAAPVPQDTAAPAATPDAASPWQIGADFGPETFRNGMDPLTILRYVAGLGRVHQVRCATGAVPALEDLDPECCRLGFRFLLDTGADAAAITAAFSFVQDDCQLSLQPPAPAAAPAATAAANTPAAAPSTDALPRLGELLVADGVATPDQVQTALQKQARQRGTGTPAPADDNRFIRVQADRLDAVINLLGELVIAGAGAQLLAQADQAAHPHRGQHPDRPADRGNPQRHAEAAHGAHRRDLLALPTRGARHRGRPGQGRGAGDHRAPTPSWTSRWSSASPTR